MEDSSDKNSTEDFEFRFFLSHGYMPNEAQKKAYQNAKNTKNTKKPETIRLEVSDEDNYDEFERALARESGYNYNSSKNKKPINAENAHNSWHNPNHANQTNNANHNSDIDESMASDEDNYREFAAALSEDANSNKTNKTNKKPNQTNGSNDTKASKIAKSNIEASKTKIPSTSSIKSDTKSESSEILYYQFVKAIDKESVSAEQGSKTDSGRKSKDYYAYVGKKPSKNQINPQDKIDLHGDTQSIAKSRLINFINRSKARGYTQILVIHGKGLHNANKIAVLKDMVECFAKTEGSHLIKNMVEAPANLGGSGAKIMWI